MAVKLQDKPNTIAPGGAYPFGDIKDNPGDNSGTPVNRLVYADFHQFFAKLMDIAGIVYNGLVENATNSFQYIDGLTAFIRQVFATEAARGTAELATQAEADAGTDDERIVTPLKLKAAKTVMGVDGAAKLRTKIVSIGAWNMASTALLNVAHGVTFTKIRSVSALIVNDGATALVPIDIFDISTGASQGSVASIDATNIQLARMAGSTFTGGSYTSTGASRGTIAIVYEV